MRRVGIGATPTCVSLGRQPSCVSFRCTAAHEAVCSCAVAATVRVSLWRFFSPPACPGRIVDGRTDILDRKYSFVWNVRFKGDKRMLVKKGCYAIEGMSFFFYCIFYFIEVAPIMQVQNKRLSSRFWVNSEMTFPFAIFCPRFRFWVIIKLS